MEDEQAFMVCVRVDELDKPVAGSTTTACVECGDDLWLPPSSKKILTEKKAMPICGRCGARMTEEYAGIARVEEIKGTPTDESDRLEELAKKLHRSKALGDAVGDIPDLVKDWLRGEGVADMDHFDRLKWSAEQAAKVMEEPTDDWGAMATIESWDGTLSPPLDVSGYMAAGLPKEIIARQVLPGVAYVAKAKRVLMGFSSWTVRGEKGGPPPEFEGSLADHPDRKEMLCLFSITGDGVERMAYAEILRDGTTAPRLGEWEESKDLSAVEGLFVEALVPALALIKGLHEKGERDS